jgi:hypothetical protein
MRALSTLLAAALLTLGLLTVGAIAPRSAHAAPAQYTCRAKVTGPEGTIRGQMTIMPRGLSVSRSFLWIKDDVSYSLRDVKGARIRRGLLFTSVRLQTGTDGAMIQARTFSWHYEPVRELLKGKL